MSRGSTAASSNESSTARWLRNNGITGEDLAEVLDCSPTLISKWLTGARRCHGGALYYTVLHLLGEDAEHLEAIKTADLTAEQKANVIVAHQSVDMCEREYQKRNPDSTAHPSR